MEGCWIRDELIAEADEALVCKTIIRGFESHPRLQKIQKIKKAGNVTPGQRLTSTTSLPPSAPSLSGCQV